jgi:RecB family exonuclease
MCSSEKATKLFAVDLDEDLIRQTAKKAENMLETESKVTVIFPNRRAVRFFEKNLSRNAFFRVDAYSFPDFVKNTYYFITKNPPLYQYDVDRYFLILNIIKEKVPNLYKKLGNSKERVFPWCIRISALFNELDRELINSVKKIEYVDNVVREAREILSEIDTLYKEYKRILETENLTFSGDLYKRFANIQFKYNGAYVFAGFTVLSKAEKQIIDNLRQNHSVTIIFQTDLKERHGYFNPYEIYNGWLNGEYWGVLPEKILNNKAVVENNIFFFESFDIHSTCSFFSANLNGNLQSADNENPLETGVVLPDENSLFPVIYSLPKCKVNITMGIAFGKTTFAKIINNLVDLSITWSKKGYYHKPLLRLLNHPLLYGFKCYDKLLEKVTLKLAKYIETEKIPFFEFESLKNIEDFSQDEIGLLNCLNEKLLKPFVNADSLYKIGETLLSFLNCIKDYLVDNTLLPLEKQVAASFTDNVLIKLLESENSKQKFENKRILYGILKHIAEEISVNFEGNPLSGIQVMGVLESRLLKFDTLHILDVNEGVMPPDNKIDPLIPENIKKEIGLQTYKHKEQNYRYYFFRLVDSCKNVYIYYQKGETNEEKKIRSRFVEQILFQKELDLILKNKADKSVKDIEKSLIRSASVFVESAFEKGAFENIVSSCSVDLKKMTISASKINDFISCPLKFYFSHILKIKEEVKIEETQDPRNVGDIIHKLLEQGFRPYEGKELNYKIVHKIKDDILAQLPVIFDKEFKTLSKIRQSLLEQTAEFRLNGFFNKTLQDLKEQDIKILAVEKFLQTVFNGYKVVGIVDRMDFVTQKEDNQSFYKVIDYKTGSYAKVPTKKISEVVKSFDFSDFSEENQQILYKQLRSVQLPLYNYLLSKHKDFNICFESVVSALYLLGAGQNEKKEMTFNGESLTEMYFEEIFKYILTCMSDTKYYYYVDSSECSFCPHYKTCVFTSHKAGY